MDTLKLNFQHSATLLLVASVFAMWPSFVQKSRVITFNKALTIQTSKAEPPRLAFDEVHLDEKKLWSEWDFLQSKDGTHLNAGDEWTKFAANSPVQNLRTKKVVLQPMVFTRAEYEKEQLDKAWVQNLPAAEQKRMIEAQYKHGTLDEDWTPPSFKELAAQKIAEAKAELAQQTSNSRVVVQSHQEDGSVLTPDAVRTADVQVQQDPTGHLVSGMIEVKGLPSGSSQWQVHVARYENDVKKEDGQVDLRKSTFQIRTADLSGTLVAQMIDTKSGFVIGEGRLRLSQHVANQQRGKAKLTIEKSIDQVASSWTSFYHDPSNLMPRSVRSKPVSTRVLYASLNTEGKTDQTGVFQFDQIQKGSWGLLRTEAKGYQSGMYLVQSGHEKKLPLFPESMIKALRQIVRDQALTSEVAETGSIVWGQVTQDGKPLAGAEVDVEFLDHYKPVYFNSLLLPDPQLKSTSENGYFAILHLPPGFHSLVASYGQAYLSHANVVVDDETASIALLESTLQTEKSEVKVFDAFTGHPSAAQLELQGLPAALNVQGYADVHLSPIQRLSFMRVTPDNPAYMEALQIYEDTSDSLHAPLIRKDWLESIRGQRKINLEPRAGIVMGFVPAFPFEVYLGHESNFSTENVVYFDAHGTIVPTGVAGGGFVIFNVPLGAQSVVVANTENNLLQTQVVPVDDLSFAVLKFR